MGGNGDTKVWSLQGSNDVKPCRELAQSLQRSADLAIQWTYGIEKLAAVDGHRYIYLVIYGKLRCVKS